MVDTPPASDNTHLSSLKIALLIMLAFVLLAIGGLVYALNARSDAPERSTDEARPNNSQNTPPGGNVTQGGNQNEDTVPSGTGTGANNLLSQ